jgi:hypothetical protein
MLDDEQKTQLAWESTLVIQEAGQSRDLCFEELAAYFGHQSART